MSITRVFLLASGLARLIEKERAGQRVQQGYFPEHHDRSAHVRVSGDAGHLVLASMAPRGRLRTLPRYPGRRPRRCSS